MYYCTAPLYNCNDPQILNEYYNITTSGIFACTLERRRRVAGRVYLIAAILNAVLVIITTALFVHYAAGPAKPPISLLTTKPNMKEFKKACKRHSLKKKSALANSLGAAGHLIFSSLIFLSQAFTRTAGCQMFLWAVIIGFHTWIVAMVIRAHRLKFLYRLNKLKVKYLRMSTAERSICLNDKDYRWYLINSRNKDAMLRRPYIIYAISICIIIIVTIPAEVLSIKKFGRCIPKWGNSTLVAYCGCFILVVAPFLLWYVKDVEDAHGIRKEIMVDILIGIPFFTLYFAWFIVNFTTRLPLPFYVNRIYGPGNWIAFFTMSAHGVSIVIPLLQYYIDTDNSAFSKFREKFTNYKWIKRLMAKYSTKSSVDTENGAQTPNTSVIPTVIPELSIESLESCLEDPDIMEQLQNLAIRDFSSENLLFYENYLKLEEAIKNMIIEKKIESVTNHIGASRHWITSITKRSPIVPVRDTEEEIKEDHLNFEMFLLLPISPTLYPDFVRFYEMYIQEGAPNQVNISFKARSSIDRVFERIYIKYPDIKSKKKHKRYIVNTDSIYINSNISHEDNSKASTDYIIDDNDDEPSLVLNLNIFEAARKEVCWNIFNSVYPKLVDVYHNSTFAT